MELELMEQLSLLAFCRRCGVPVMPPRKGGSMVKRTCAPCQREFDLERKRRHKARNPGARRAEYERNRDRYLERAKEYAQQNPERRRSAVRAWRERNPGISNAKRAERRGKGDCVISLDAIDKAIIKAIYAKRDRTGLGGGLGPGYYNVDHIQPLALGGVHAPWNMQILPWEENQSKKDRRPTLREVLRGERRYRLLRLVFLAHASELGTAA
jgi:uncharacterized Zn finger protein (UPF0148 family)